MQGLHPGQSWILDMRTGHASLGLDTRCGTGATSEYWVKYMEGRIRQTHQVRVSTTGVWDQAEPGDGFRVGGRKSDSHPRA